jgi:PKD repeat protein
MKKIVYLIVSIVIFSSCNKKDDDSTPNNVAAPAPIACFTVEKNIVAIDSNSGYVFVFTNCSQNSVRYEWDFGDTTYAPVANPIHIYHNRGYFIVKMTAYNSDDVASTTFDTISIGHYTLDKIVFRHTFNFFTPPYLLRMKRSGYFNVSDTLFSESMLPLTIQLADSNIYDFNSNPVQYGYQEDSANYSVARNFSFYSSSIINNQFDTALNFGIWDTAKFTMYFNSVIHP